MAVMIIVPPCNQQSADYDQKLLGHAILLTRALKQAGLMSEALPIKAVFRPCQLNDFLLDISQLGSFCLTGSEEALNTQASCSMWLVSMLLA